MRGDVYELRSPRAIRGHEQAGSRYAVVVQSDFLPLSTLLVAPTSTSAWPATFRPEIEVQGQQTRVLAEQTAAVDPERLGSPVGHLTFEELSQVDAALRLVLSLSQRRAPGPAAERSGWEGIGPEPQGTSTRSSR